MYVIGGVVEELGLERADGPVGALEFLALVDRDAERGFQDGGEPEAIHAGEGGGDAGVEEGGHAEAPVSVEASYVVVAGVEYDFDALIGEQVAEGNHVVEREGVNEEYLSGGCGYLDEADALGVAKEAVGLEVEGDTGLCSERIHYAEEAGLVLYELGVCGGDGVPPGGSRG